MKPDKLQKLYEEYLELCTAGRTAEQALAEFDYLHPTSFSQLVALIKKRAAATPDN